MSPEQRRRELERAAFTGDFDAALRFLHETNRAGKLDLYQVRYLAGLKAEPYRTYARDEGLAYPLSRQQLLGPGTQAREFFQRLGGDNIADILIAACKLAVEPKQHDQWSDAGLRSAKKTLRLMILLRERPQSSVAKVLYRNTRKYVRRQSAHLRGQPSSEWEQEHRDPRSAHLLTHIFLDASSYLIATFAHGLAMEMGWTVAGKTWDMVALETVRAAFDRFYARRFQLIKLSSRPPFTDFREDMASVLSEEWGLPLAVAPRRNPPYPNPSDWYANAARRNEEALRRESAEQVPPAAPLPGSVVMPSGSRYMVAGGNPVSPSEGLALWRPGELDAVVVEPTEKGVHVRQGSVDVPSELVVTMPPNWEFTLAVINMISRADNEERPISQWALGVSAKPLLDMLDRYGLDALSRDWDQDLPADDRKILEALAKRGVL